MKPFAVFAVLVALVTSGCSSDHSLSGTYVASVPSMVSTLQLTENRAQQLMGVLTFVVMKDDGTLGTYNTNITGGSTDGRTVTLVLGKNSMFSSAHNWAGTVTSSGAISISFGGTMPPLILKPANQTEVSDAMNSLATLAKAKHADYIANQEAQKRQAALHAEFKRDSDYVTSLTQALQAFDRGEATANVPAEMKAKENQILGQARTYLARGKKLRELAHNGDRSASASAEGAFRAINGFDNQLVSLGNIISSRTAATTNVLKSLDGRITNNPCDKDGEIPGCRALASELKTYAGMRAKAMRHVDATKTDFENSRNQMRAIKEAAAM